MRLPDETTPAECPNCSKATVDIVQHASESAQVWWLRCGACGHIWATPKKDDLASASFLGAELEAQKEERDSRIAHGEENARRHGDQAEHHMREAERHQAEADRLKTAPPRPSWKGR